MNWRTMTAVFSLEIRRILSYRVDFWVQFLGTVIVQFSVAWFLWRAIFEARGAGSIVGYDFDHLMLYYLLVPLVDRLTRGFDNFVLSREIYDGSLTRYLIYPIPFFLYKYIGQVARASISLAQLGVGIVAFALLYGLPENYSVTGEQIVLALILCGVASVCYYFMAISTEMVAFWADNVWSLMVMLRFICHMFGGAFLPVELYPTWAREILFLTPFPHLISVPIRLLMGEAGGLEFVQSFLILSGWSLTFFAVARVLWKSGTREYTGVGI